MLPKARLLVVDDEPIKRTILEDELRGAGYVVETATNPLEAEPLLAKGNFDVVLTDLRMPGLDGLSFLRNLKQAHPEQAVILMTAYATVATAVEAMQLGAFDYLQKPFSTQELLLKLNKLLAFTELSNENKRLKEQLAQVARSAKLVGQSDCMRAVQARIHAIAPLDTTVLIEGETGTGKEVVARTIHESSYRRNAAFVAVSCAALPPALIESELFGHEAGAFTNASKRRLGRFESAHGGTLFLDDVDDIPCEVQVKLLRVLQEHCIERIGSSAQTRINVRIIAATKKALRQLVTEGSFREDLYYRLSVVPLELPPLRKRLDDIPLLAEYFLAKLAIRFNKNHVALAPDALAKLQAYHWPGNVRELEHVLERMVALCTGDQLTCSDLPDLMPCQTPQDQLNLPLDQTTAIDLAGWLQTAETRMIKWALAKNNGNLAQTAQMLSVPRSTLQYKISKLLEDDSPVDAG